MTALKRNNGDKTKTLKEEIRMMRNSDVYDKKLLKITKFDPTDSMTCFLGMFFGEGDSSLAGMHRRVVGIFTHPDYRHVGGGLTPLEVWSALQWENGGKAKVKEVFNYIKKGGRFPTGIKL